MSDTSKNPMSEDELLSALGISAEPAKGKSEPTVIDGDILIDMLAPDSPPSRKSKANTERERAREEQERERSLRSKEWKRELEQQQRRAAAEASAAEEAKLAEQMVSSKIQPAIPNSSDMRDIEDVAAIADEKRRAADEVERRRLAMQEQVRRRQEEVAAEARAAEEQARRRAQEQEAARQQAAEQLAVKQREQARAQRQSQPLRSESDKPQAQWQSESQRLTHQGRAVSQTRPNGEDKPLQSRPVQQQRTSHAGASRSAQIPSRSQRIDDAPRSQRQGLSQNLGTSAPISRQVRSDASNSAPITRPRRQEAPMPEQSAPLFQAPAPQQMERMRPVQDIEPRRGGQDPNAAKESPLGIVLIVLAVLCVLVAASLLTGLWDISNL